MLNNHILPAGVTTNLNSSGGSPERFTQGSKSTIYSMHKRFNPANELDHIRKAQEFDAHVARLTGEFADIDKNGDGMIDREELE